MTIAAGVVGNLGVAALLVLATLDMPAERRGTAALDGRHHLQLVEADVPGVGRPPCRAMVAEDIRDLQLRTGHCCGRLRRRLASRKGRDNPFPVTVVASVGACCL